MPEEDMRHESESTEIRRDSGSALSRPGSLAIPDGSPPPRIHVLEYDATSIDERDIVEIESLHHFVATPRTTWIDIQGLGDEQRLLEIGQILGIHPLALSDAVNCPQRAKTQQYPGHIVMIIRAPRQPFDPFESVPQVCILLGEGYVVTFQERYFAFFTDLRARVRDGDPTLRRAGAGFLVHALVDALVDHYYPVVEDIAEQLDEIEASIFGNPTPEAVSRLHQLQRKITTLRRVARPQVEALYKLAHTPTPLLPQNVHVFMLDAEDHAKQILGRLDASRDVATDTMSAVLATLGHRQNEIMKVLTLVGSIFIPLTFIAGIYGMNFENMPELKARLGYPIALCAMGIVAVGMVLLFRARGWIGSRSK